MHKISGRPLVAFWIVSLLAAFDTLVLSGTKDGWLFVLLLVAYLGGIVGAQSLAIIVAGNRRLPRRVQPLVVTGFAVANLISFKLAFSEALLGLPDVWKWTIVLVFALLVHLLVVQPWEAQRRVLLSLAVPLMLFSLINDLFKVGNPAGNADALNQYAAIRLKDRPNIHVLAFDSMVPGKIAEANLGVHVGYQRFLEENALLFRNSFAVYPDTVKSMNGFLRLEDSRLGGEQYFSGAEPSPLFTLFRNNGYQLASGFQNGLFGPKGEFVDVYYSSGLPFPFRGTTSCLDMDSQFLGIQKVWGMCRNTKWQAFTAQFFGGEELAQQQSENWPGQVRSFILAGAGDRPTFTVHYIVQPIGHTSKSFRRDDPKKRAAYQKRFSQQAGILTEYLISVRDELLKKDPAAIVVVMGDHGAFAARGVDAKQEAALVFLDGHAVSLSVLKSDNRCAKPGAPISTYSREYATAGRVFAGIIRCLAEDGAAVDRAVSFVEDERFTRFRYE